MSDLPESFRVSPQLFVIMRISQKLCHLCPYDIRNGTLETCSKRTDTYICILIWIEQSFLCTVLSDTRRHIRKHEITSTERILLLVYTFV